MLEVFFSREESFNRLFCKYRIRSYIDETADFISRHKLLLTFIILLLAPGIHALSKIGMPFFEIIDPTATLTLKLACLVTVLVISLALTSAQLNFIKGGKLRNYIETFNISPMTHKKIDFLILVLSLNFLWVAIVLGACFTYKYSHGFIFSNALLILYFSFIFNYLVFLLCKLYNHKKQAFFLILNIFFISFAPLLDMVWVNYVVAILTCLFGLFVFWNETPLEQERKSSSYSDKDIVNKMLGLFGLDFTITLATYKQNRKRFYTKILYCTMLNTFIVYMASIHNLHFGNIKFFIILLGGEAYLFSTLFSLFQKDENNYKMFHSIFPRNQLIKSYNEILFMFFIFLISTFPLMLYSALTDLNLFASILFVFFAGFIPVTINRLLYRQSLRFCLFFSLISSMLWIMVQYWALGVIF